MPTATIWVEGHISNSLSLSYPSLLSSISVCVGAFTSLNHALIMFFPSSKTFWIHHCSLHKTQFACSALQNVVPVLPVHHYFPPSKIWVFNSGPIGLFEDPGSFMSWVWTHLLLVWPWTGLLITFEFVFLSCRMQVEILLYYWVALAPSLGGRVDQLR